MPTPSAASRMPGSRLACAVTALRRIGSSAYSESASSAGRKPSVGSPSPNTARRLSRIGKNSASSASAGMVWTRLANPSVARATAGERLAQIASGSATAMPSAIAAAESSTCAASLSPRPSRAAPISFTVRAPPAGRPARGERRRGPARSCRQRREAAPADSRRRRSTRHPSPARDRPVAAPPPCHASP